jgi:hypothetical protein
VRAAVATTSGGSTSVDVEGHQIDWLLQSFIPRLGASGKHDLTMTYGKSIRANARPASPNHATLARPLRGWSGAVELGCSKAL